MAYLKAISYYLPEATLDNVELSKLFPEWSVEKVTDKLGITQRHIAGSNEFTSDMAIKASQKLFSEHNIDPKEIDFVILCTQSPDYFLPTTACLVQHALGIPTHAGAIDFNQGCSGYIYGLSLAKGLIKANIAKNILFITSETYSKFIHNRDKSNRAIFGDAASASLISTNGNWEILNFSLGTDGSGAENLIVKNGASKAPSRENNVKIEEEEMLEGRFSDNNLYMNGTEIFNFTLESVPKLVRNTLDANELDIESIDYFIFHQANKYMLNHLRKKIGIPEDKFVYFMANCGNTVSSTIPIVLYEQFKDHSINYNNGNILLAGFGVGYSWGGVVLKQNKK